MQNFFVYLFTILTIITILSCQNYITDSGEDQQREFTTTEKQVLNSSNKFGLNLFRSVNRNDKDKNVFISPLSVSLALGMTMNGTNGETHDEMRATLQFAGLTNEDINKSYKSLIETLYASDPKVVFSSANSIWYRNEMKFEQSFFDLSIKYFNALIKDLDFNNSASVGIINNWVKENTQNKIEKILERINRGDVMYLINAIYFKGTWTYEFDKEETKPDEFILQNGELINTNLMVQTNDFNYYSNEELQAIELPYCDGNFSMIILLPKEGLDINLFAEKVNETSMNSWIHNLSEKKGTLWLPKFKIEFNSELNEYLIALGMEKAFDPSQADFTNLYIGPEQLWIGKVIHKTFVEVDEEGTEAAAVTLVCIVRTTNSGGDNIFFMKVNRPFLFLIKEKNSDCILFVGKIINPN